MLQRIIRRKAKPFLSQSSSLWFQPQSRKLGATELALLTPEAILNDQVREACVKRLKLIGMTKKSDDNPNKAAVLVPLCIYNGKMSLLYTLRSNKVSTNRGQVSFPGGKKDSKDKTLEDTALRETWEELHIHRNTVDVWGSGNLVERKHVSVMPVLGFIGEVDPESLSVNKNEVEEAFVQPLEKLCDPRFCRYTQFRDSYTLPVYVGNHKIWGLTAVITHLVMSALIPSVYKHKIAYSKPIEEDSKNSPTSSKAKKS